MLNIIIVVRLSHNLFNLETVTRLTQTISLTTHNCLLKVWKVSYDYQKKVMANLNKRLFSEKQQKD